MKMPVAKNCVATPLAILGLVGVTWMLVNSAAVTVKVVLPDTLSIAAEIDALPTVTAVASPDSEIVATAVLVELHET